VLISEGQDVLYGRLDDIRRRFSGHAVLVRATDELPTVPGVAGISLNHNAVKLSLAEGTNPQDVLHNLVARGVVLERFEIAVPTLEEIFIRVVEES
jgi:ABC-2 type transport system ATP-binding protein